MGPMKTKTSFPPPEFTAGDHCPECGNHFAQGHDAGCSQIQGKWGSTAASRDFEANSPWSADYWLRRAIIEFEHPADPGDWDRWNEHALHGTEENEPQRHQHEPVLAHRKQAWMGWGPDVANGSHHKVAGWDWDPHLNAYTSTGARKFTCNCGQTHEVPGGYSNCKCGKSWNSYVIGTNGSGSHRASAELFLVREIPSRGDSVIVANRRLAQGTFGDLNEGDEISASYRGGPGSIGGDYRHRVHKIEEGKSGRTRNITYETISTPSDEDWPPGGKRTTRHNHATPLPPAWKVHRKEGHNRQAVHPDDLVFPGHGYDLDSEVEDTTPWPTEHHPSAGEATMRAAPSDWHSRRQDGKWTSGGAPSAHQFKKRVPPE